MTISDVDANTTLARCQEYRKEKRSPHQTERGLRDIEEIQIKLEEGSRQRAPRSGHTEY